MGGSESKTTVNHISEQISKVAMETVQSCEVSSQQKQKVRIINTGFRFWGSYKVEQQTDISNECFSDVKKQTELQNKVFQKIAQASTASGVGILSAFGASKSEAETNLRNTIKNSVTMKNIQRSYTEIRQEQEVDVITPGVSIVEKVELTQGAKVFAMATLKELDRAGVFNAITAHIDQKSKAETKSPLDFIADIFGAIGRNIVLIIIVIIVIISGVALALMLRRGSPARQGAGDDVIDWT